MKIILMKFLEKKWGWRCNISGIFHTIRVERFNLNKDYSMGTCSSIYIEFKKRSDKQWHLLEAILAAVSGNVIAQKKDDDDLDRGEMLEY